MKNNNISKFENIPEIMKKLPNWVGRTKEKRPINIKTGEFAKVNDSSTWADFSEACKLANENVQIVGVGFVLNSNNGIIGVDIDHCIDNGKIYNPKILDLIKLVKSYVEYSPSGTGVHFYIKGEWPKNIGNRKNIDENCHIEVYDDNRYFTVTGDMYNGDDKLRNDILDEPDVLEYLLTNFFSDSKKQNTNNLMHEIINTNENLNMNQEIENLCINNSYFKSLWDGKRPKGNESSDDIALFYQLCRIVDNEQDLINLFLQSGHYKTKDKAHKEKCERADYLPRTAVAALNFWKKGISEEESDDISLLQYDDYDIGNGEKFVQKYSGELLYCEDEKRWYCFDGIYWEPCKQSKINNKAKELQKLLLRLVNIVGDECRIKVLKRLGNNDSLNNMIKSAKDTLVIDEKKFNNFNNLLAVANGVIDLHTGELVEAVPEYYITVRSPIAYNKEAAEPIRFIQFMNEICCGDIELREYLLRVLGYCLTGEIREQAFFIFYGSGANGKSVLVNILRHVLGTLVGCVAQDAFIKKRGDNTTNPTLVKIKNTRIGFVSEGNAGQELDSALVKTISGGDEVQARALYRNHDSFNPHFKIIMTTNFLPNMDFSDDAMRRRAKIIKFDNVFTGEKCDNELPKKLEAESEGILKLLVDYAVKYYAEGLASFEPDSISYNFNNCRVESDSVYAFVQEHIIVSNEDIEQSSVLYQHYCEYCIDNKFNKKTQKAFTQAMKKLGFESDMRTENRVMCFLNVKYSEKKEEL